MNDSRNPLVSGFVKADGKRVVNGDGQEILLQGVGLGSWLLPEGYMWKMPEQGDRPRRIEGMIRELIGEEKAAAFWETYYDRYISEADIRQIAAEGFNSIRVPINARFIMEEGQHPPFAYHEGHLRLIDRVIDWCRTYSLYVILDLHGAPGGQTGANIDDSERDLPELFTDRLNAERTVALWRMLAERYKDEWIVAGYDLLNEPLPDWFSEYNDRVMPLYKEITAAIREVDKRHMIILEGVHWSTDWSIFDDKFDDNLMLQFHKYWNNPDTESIQKYIDLREEWNVPIFMGEGGENNPQWYTGAFRMFEDHNISWNFWTWKKMNTRNSPFSIRMPEGWDKLTGYLEGGAKPSPAEAEAILGEYLDRLPLEACDAYPNVARSLLRRLPIQIPAEFYGYRGEGVSYHVETKASQDIGFRISDGVPMRMMTGKAEKPSYASEGGKPWAEDNLVCVQLREGDWLAYDALCAGAGIFHLDVRALIPEGTVDIMLQVGDREPEAISLSSGPGEGQWHVHRLAGGMPIEEGPVDLVFMVNKGRIELDWLEFTEAR
ncbi:glycoside hydrolase family 5 protein [Paenibacillus lautus]|uniref:glycoside hydrolase family 5 protein n=1 Tax=Paenibacillus lautus TaxID=1401 RepID=UPI000BBD580B|nr:glycoside hydrolase family 5 protein [Paenibacillus lautus]PCL92542.1 glycoside hydrolase [Paenibacillus lautus]